MSLLSAFIVCTSVTNDLKAAHKMLNKIRNISLLGKLELVMSCKECICHVKTTCTYYST